MNNVSVHIFFCVSIAIDVLEPGTDLSIEYVLHRSTERQLSLHLQDIYSSTIGRHRSNVIDPRNKKERKEVSHFRFPKERLISTSSTSNGLNRSVTPTKTLTIAKQFPLLGSSPYFVSLIKYKPKKFCDPASTCLPRRHSNTVFRYLSLP